MVSHMRYLTLRLSLRVVRSALLVLLTALVLVQTVGVLHRVAHAQHQAGVNSHQPTEAHSHLAAIWGEHGNSADCQLFDQTCPDLLHVPLLAMLVFAAVPVWLAATLSERFALFERFYAARGPPAALR
jgi:hypothetical protein